MREKRCKETGNVGEREKGEVNEKEVRRESKRLRGRERKKKKKKRERQREIQKKGSEMYWSGQEGQKAEVAVGCLLGRGRMDGGYKSTLKSLQGWD